MPFFTFFFLMLRRPPRSTLFPYTTLFRSEGSLVRVAEFIELERRCCPFFRFELEVQDEGRAAWLRLTGRMGVKQFIAAELGLEKSGNEGAVNGADVRPVRSAGRDARASRATR